MYRDPIVEEVRRVRQKHAAKFGYDLKKIVEDFRKLEKMEQELGRKVVILKPRRIRVKKNRNGA